MNIFIPPISTEIQLTDPWYFDLFDEFINFEEHVLGVLKEAAYAASIELARKKGPFPLYDERYLESKFVRTLTPNLFAGLIKHGIRNSHLLSIAPTGTISLCADNVSSGLEPVFRHEIARPVETAAGHETQNLVDYGVAFLNVRGKLADEVTPEEHVRVLAAAQKHVDSSISKTVNVDGAKMSWDEFKHVYRRAWELGAKSCTTFNVSGSRGALLEPAKPADAPACEVINGVRSCE